MRIIAWSVDGFENIQLKVKLPLRKQKEAETNMQRYIQVKYIRNRTIKVGNSKIATWKWKIKKRVRNERSWCKQGVRYHKRYEYEIIYLLKDEYSIKYLCELMSVNRSGYYKWLARKDTPNRYEQDRILLTKLLMEEHFGSHSCRIWSLRFFKELSIKERSISGFWDVAASIKSYHCSGVISFSSASFLTIS